MQDTAFVPVESKEPPKPHFKLTALVRSPLAWLFLFVALAYLPIFWGDIIFFRDPAHWNYPARAFVRQALLRGEFPHWNPFVGLGVPVWANPLYGVLYPPNWLLLLVPERLVAAALTWQSAAHTLFGGVGLYCLARQFRCRPIASLVAGMAWAFSGHTTSMWSAGLLLIAGAWLPWVAVGMLSATKDVLLQRAFVKAIPKVAAPIAMALLTGEVFVAMMSVGFGMATVAAWWFGERKQDVDIMVTEKRNDAFRVTKAIFGGIALGVMVGFIVIAPARSLVAGTPRSNGIGIVQAERYSFHPLRILEFIVPSALGVPNVNYPGAKYAGEPAIDGLPLAFNCYLGASVIALALLSFGRRRRSEWVLLGLWIFFLFVCFGRHTPVHSAWRLVALPFKYMRYPEKYVVLLVGWSSLLAALGFERIIANGRFKGRRLLAFIFMLAAGLVVPGLVFDHELARFMQAGAVVGVAVTAAIFALQFLPRHKANVAHALIVAVVAFDLLSNVWELLPFKSGDVAHAPSQMAAVIKLKKSDAPFPPRLYRSNKIEASTFLALTPNIGTLFGIASVPGYDAAKPSAIEEFWARGLQYQATLLRLLSIEFTVLPVADPAAPDKRVEVFEPLMDPTPGARLYRVKGILPRAYVAASSLVLSDAAALERIFSPDVASGAMAVVSEGQGERPMIGPAKLAGTCQLEAFDLNRVAMRCNSDVPGIAVLVEQFSAGWSATVDGVATRLLRVNHVMRGVHLMEGSHRVEMYYHAPVSVGVISITVLGLLTIAALFVSKSKRAPKGPLELVG